MAKSTNAIKTKIYPMIEKALSNNNILSKYRKMLSEFINSRSEDLFDICPCSRIIYTTSDEEEFFKVLNINKREVEMALKETYYAKMSNFNPRCAKDPLTVCALLVVRYFYTTNKPKDLDLSCIYLSFSGSIYPSVHYGSFRYTPDQYRHVMEYVVNNKLSNKFDLKREGSVLGAVKSIYNTWLNTYSSELKSFSDEDAVYLLLQLRNRIKSFMKNIASEFYDAYNSVGEYISYDSDDFSQDSYREVDNNSMIIERIVESTMNYINTTTVDYATCKLCTDNNIKLIEVKQILDSIYGDKNNIPMIKELIRLIVVEYFQYSKQPDVRSMEFITYTLAQKPNTKNKNVLRYKEILDILLTNSDSAYNRRKHRNATKCSYQNALLKYHTIMINKVAKM